MSLALGVGLGALVAGAALVRWARSRWIVVTVQGYSMEPTLRDGQRLIARRLSGSGAGAPGYVRSDIVVFLLPRSQIEAMDSAELPYRIKRVAAVPGDPVPDWALEALSADAQSRVPPGKVVVSGDNPRSQDSRQLGYIDSQALIAVVRL
ncbi:S26 family signal peptidase [Archangium minus]|uniref:Signal peptidase I n=1 Tax=Archangium minus TaxID=83450 RepID=A0ABY9WQ96_9BACT|nr:S26 family signal peptidase [Archangium violaceum]WNG45974.1 S26 family signal peptidase [Archangium minus]